MHDCKSQNYKEEDFLTLIYISIFFRCKTAKQKTKHK